MEFPEQAVKDLIAFLKKTDPSIGLYEAFIACTLIASWLAWVIFKSGIVTVMGAAPHPSVSRDDAICMGLQELLNQHASGVQALAFNIPQWLLPLLKLLLAQLLNQVLP